MTYFGTQLVLSLGPLELEPRNTCRLFCAMTVHVKMWRAAGVSVYNPRRLPGNSIAGKRKKKRKSVSEQQKKHNFCSTSNRPVPIKLMKTKDAAGFPVTSMDKTFILFEDRLSDVSFTCSSCSLFYSRFASTESKTLIQWSWNTFFAQLEYPIFSHYDLFSLLLQCRSDLPMQVRHTQPTQFLTKTCGVCRTCAIFPKRFCNHRAWVGELSAASPWPCCTFAADRKLHVWHHGWGSVWWRNLVAYLYSQRAAHTPAFNPDLQCGLRTEAHSRRLLRASSSAEHPESQP